MEIKFFTDISRFDRAKCLQMHFQSDDERKRLITALYLAYRNIKSEETRLLVSQVLNELEKEQ